MKYTSNQRGVITQIALFVIVVAIVAVAAVAYMKMVSRKGVPASKASTPTPTASPSPSPTATPSDTTLITSAVRAYTAANANDAVSDIVIDGLNAKGNGAAPGAPSGYEFIAHKTNGTWSIVYEGQELPGKSIGEKYGLPTSWYSTSY